ncbi:Cysteine_desulfurase / Selenide [Hexamita inflata]|nr:Cysteine desulfurase / Selenide [Hexamita inflata]
MMAESLLSQQKENEFISNCFGNPSSSHVYGVEAKQSLNLARKQTASLIDCQPSEIVFTSGGTESNNMAIQGVQLWEVELLFLVYYVSNYILKYFATSNADDKFQYIISSWRLFMNYSLTQEGQKYDFDRIRPQSTIQSRYLIFQKGKIEITTCNKRTAMTKINAVEDVQGRSTNSLNKLRQF